MPIIPLFLCWALTSSVESRAADYTAVEIQQIATLVDARASKRLSPSAFEEAIGSLVQVNGVNVDLITKLLASQNPRITGKGIDFLRAASRKTKALAAAQLELAQKADEAKAAHAKVQVAKEEARKAHEEAASNPTDAEKTKNAEKKAKQAQEAVTRASEVDAEALRKINAFETSQSGWAVYLWSGAKLQNPYSITNGTLKPNNNRTDGFLDLQLVHRAVLSDATDEDPVFFGRRERKYGEDGKWDWFIPLQLFPDIELKMGYVFGGSSTPTNITVSTIAGGSDLYAESALGLPFWRWTSKGGWNQQATIELGGGFVTDKQFLALHPNYFAGFGYQVHHKDWTWFTRFGFGGADVPRLVGTSTVQTDSSGQPIFDLRSAPSWGAQVTYRLNDAISIQLGANAYLRSEQPTWNLSAGILIDPSITFKSFSK